MSDASAAALLSPVERRRAFTALFASAAISTTGFLASNTVNGLIAEDLTGSAALSGLPAAASVLGTALGASALASLVRRVGPRGGLTIGYAVAALSVAVASWAILAGHFTVFVVSVFVFGAGYGANRLARYVAGDLYTAERRGTMIGWIVWASTIGAVAGPALLAPSRELAGFFSVNGLIGPYFVCLAACAISAAAMFSAPARMDTSLETAAGHAPAPLSLRALLADRGVALALSSMVSGQFVMVLLMTMTPLHIRHQGHGLGAIGLVISAHTLGMFALSPVTGRVGDRIGRVPVLAAGMVVLLVSCALGVVAAGGSYPVTVVALLLLGIGWNLGFVAGSALLTDSIAREHRMRIQGLGDTLIWGGGALASLSSGWLLELVGFAGLSAAGAVLALAPLVPLLRHRAGAAITRAAD